MFLLRFCKTHLPKLEFAFVLALVLTLFLASGLLGIEGVSAAQLSESDVRSTDDFCQKAQQMIAGTSLESENKVHSTMESFIKSKAVEYPLQTHQFVGFESADTKGASLALTISCKLKTAERINNGLIESGDNEVSSRATNERSCKYVNQNTWHDVFSSLTSIQKVEAKKRIVFDDDDNTFMGPFWLRPWPYQVAYTRDGVTHIRSKSLHIEYSIFIPMPARFMGTHYCHLIAQSI